MVNILDYIDKMQVMYGDKDPSSMAQEPRNMFADGQLVRPNDDGSRPGYAKAKNKLLEHTTFTKLQFLVKLLIRDQDINKLLIS